MRRVLLLWVAVLAIVALALLHELTCEREFDGFQPVFGGPWLVALTKCKP